MTKILVTSALPYANGSIHIGHLVEYIQTDIFVRFLRIAGEDVIYCCADDTHGTPIEINAAKKGKTPEEFIKHYHQEHISDFDKYHIKFDSYYTTNSPENKHYVHKIFNRLKQKGHIYTKDIELTYCENCKRFLPDRYVRGKCPECGAEDQYGDICEKCNTAYKTTDLVEPRCSICHKTPVTKKSNHYFFRLSEFSDKLKDWLVNNKNLQSEIRNQVLNWIENGLDDWNISRDGPYFGFKIPGEDEKYFYVWLDAPVGYIASTANYCKDKDCTAEDYWEKQGAKIIHFIGKDIIYFHLLFWPAVLMGADFNVPDDIVVHGFLTVNREKMSKSRGTFLTASEFAEIANPEYLRYYYASNLPRNMKDVDLDLDDFRQKINRELIAKVGNFFYRVLHFANKRLDGEIGPAEESFLKRFNYQPIINDYENVEFRSAVKKIIHLCNDGNKYFQDNEPWALEDKQKVRQVISNSVNLVRDINILLKPILPVFTEKIEKQLNTQATIKDLGTNLGEHKVNPAKILLDNIEELNLETKDPFTDLDLRVAEIRSVKDHPDADKLLVMEIDLGKEKRTIVAGLKKHYDKEELVGKKIVVVKNLKPAKLRGIESQGMLLAADSSEGPKILEAKQSNPGEKVTAGLKGSPKEVVEFSDFKEIKIKAKGGEIFYRNKKLHTQSEKIKTDTKQTCEVR